MYLATPTRTAPHLTLMAWERQRPRRRSTIGNYRGIGATSAMGLAAITAAAATEQIFPQAQVQRGAGHNQTTRDIIMFSAQAGQILGQTGLPTYIPGTGDCASSGVSTNVKLAQVSGQMALTGVGIAAMASKSVLAALGGATVLGAATLGIGTLIGLLPLLLGHHAAAVKKERNVLCTVVPATNNYLQIIDQGLTSGQATPQQAMAALDSLVSDFRSQVASIIHGADPMSSGECNAACAMLSALRSIVLVKKSQYQDLADQKAAAAASPAAAASSLLAPVTGAVAQAAASTGIPSWAFYAAGGLLLWKLL